MKKTIIAVVITIVACVVILGGIVAAGIAYNRNAAGGSQGYNDGSGGSSDKLSVDPSAGEYVAPVAPENENDGIAIPGWGYISLPANETEIEVDFPNPEANDGKYYLSFELRLKDSGEILYTSGLVPPGKTIQHITLSRGLDEGTHKAVVHVQPYKMDEAQTPTNNADMETDLVVYKK